MSASKYRVKTSRLRKNCDPSMFKFISTAEVKPLYGVIGQDRAVESLSFALDIEHSGYNIYLSGAFGTGKTTLAKEVLKQKAINKPVPPDWCYVYNFKHPDCPKALLLPPGLGRQFKKDISVQMSKTMKQIPKALDSDDFEYIRSSLLSSFFEETNDMYLRLDEETRTYGYTITRNQNGAISSVPIKNGEPLSQEDYMAMTEEERADLMKRSTTVQEKLSAKARQHKELERSVRDKIKKLEQETARATSAPYFADLFEKYRNHKDVVEYLEEMQMDLLDNLDVFFKQEENPATSLLRNINKRATLRRFQVNLIVDNYKLKHAPVIFETNPTYANLFGQIEYEGEFGVLSTDFSKIKSGTIHKANGGYLVLNLFDVIKNFYIWDALKRVLKNRSIRIESVSRMFGVSNTETIEPEEIPADIKVVIIGEPFYFYLLYSQDEEFRKLFKIRADFDIEMPRTTKTINQYARFISAVCENEKVKHFTPDGVARVIDYSSRMSEDQTKLSTLFNKLVEVIYEADKWASYDKADLITAKHVQKSIDHKRYRSAMMEEKTQDYIAKGIFIINITDKKIGEINGLAVYQMGDYSYGRPVRITAKTFMGETGLVNIEREIRLSGNIHSKRILTLNGYLGDQYAQNRPLSLSASLTFEQSYHGIEGDSASSAELYALLSSLAQTPIYQGIAVTGSVNQNGDIQPVGGVNQKIEGFFEVCKKQKLNGKQGVIIPHQNVANLMLSEDVVDAVKNKEFNIWAIKHVDQGIELLTGIPAGKKENNGKFTPGTIHDKIDNRLEDWINRRELQKKERTKPLPASSKRRREHEN